MNDFVKDTMQIIEAIKKYKDKYGNTQIIDEYYQLHGTYDGIIEKLKRVQKELKY